MDTEPKTENNPEDKPQDERSKVRESLRDPKSIEDMRARLYARGRKQVDTVRTPLVDTTKQVPNTWGASDVVKKNTQERIDDTPLEVTKSDNNAYVPPSAPPSVTGLKTGDGFIAMKKRKKSYRVKALIAGIGFFVLALIVSSSFLFFGGNTISGSNISIDISPRPLTIGGGEELSFQVGISNQNSVPIESATLIVNYGGAPGTQSAENPGEELFSERRQLNNIEAGEVVNVPMKAILFGEENDERVIAVSVEYRVTGSNAIFFKEADLLRLKINSSPIVLRVDSVESISSGQEVAFEIVVESNSPTALKDVLVKASYPFGFDFVESDIETASGQDTWLIESLEPEEERTIVVRGVVNGKEEEERTFIFSAGVANERDSFNLASIFSKITTNIAIEQPFLDIDVSVNGDSSKEVVVNREGASSVNISFNNSQDEAIYDGIVSVTLGGNALDEFEIDAKDGFYDSNTNTVTWDSVDVKSLEEILPGNSSFVGFNLIPTETVSRTPEITMDVAVSGQRIFADTVPQQLVGGVTRKLRVESLTSVVTSVEHEDGSFKNTGPIPPVAEEVTQYTISMSATNGSNDITDAEVTAILPQYMTWLDLKTIGDIVTYDAATRVVRWNIGSMDANSTEDVSVQVSIRPSLSQVGSTPTILGEQRFKAVDRFTGTTLRTITPAVTTKLFYEFDDIEDNGRVQEE